MFVVGCIVSVRDGGSYTSVPGDGDKGDNAKNQKSKEKKRGLGAIKSKLCKHTAHFIHCGWIRVLPVATGWKTRDAG